MSQHFPEQANNVIGGDHTVNDTLFIDYWEHEEVVFIKQFRDLPLLGIHAAGDERLGNESLKERVLLHQDDGSKRNHANELVLTIEDEQRTHRFGAAGEAEKGVERIQYV